MEIIKFDTLGLDPKILRAITEMGFEEPSPIQAKAIPEVMAGHDVIGQAQTGTGKTAAFGIPLLQKIDPKNRKLQAIILCPTRELAIQVADEIRRDSDEIIRKKYIRTITFDFSGTTFMDSSGIGLLMGRYRMMGMRGDCIQATGVNSYIEKLLHLSGVYKFVEIC